MQGTSREKLEKYSTEDFDVLTPKQSDVIHAILAGKTIGEIARDLGCSRQNICQIISSGLKRLEKYKADPMGIKQPKKQVTRDTKNSDYEKYASADFSALTPEESKVMRLRIEGKTYPEIADILLKTPGCVGSLLARGRMKLDGVYEEKYKKILESQKRYREKHREEFNRRCKENYHRRAEQGLIDRDKRREYNKKYYQENRERVLEKEKLRRQTKNLN